MVTGPKRKGDSSPIAAIRSALEADAANNVLPESSRAECRQAAEFLRAAVDTSAVTRSLPQFALNNPFSQTIHLDFVYLYTSAPERALETYEDTIKTGQLGGQGGSFAYLWQPSYAPVRKTERFKEFVRDAGMAEYWRAKGWPEFCQADDRRRFRLRTEAPLQRP